MSTSSRFAIAIHTLTVLGYLKKHGAERVTSQQIADRPSLNLNSLVTEIPGVVISHSANNPNTSFNIRGTGSETRTEIDGHPIGGSTDGVYYSLYSGSELFGGVDVSKGAGLTGPTAGYSGVGTVNMRTRDFTTKDSAFFDVGGDSFNGTFYSAFVDHNFLNDKLSVLVGGTVNRFQGPSEGNTVAVLGSGQSINSVYQQYGVPSLSNDVVGWLGDFSSVNKVQGELAKIRYRFSESTSLSGTMLAMQGAFNPQAGGYGVLDGNLTVPQCVINNVAVNVLATCQGNNLAVYNAPNVQNLVGKSVPVYTFFPGSNVYWSQPNFSFEFKTTLKNDTILFRPYTASITRLIDGSGEPNQAGYAGGWYPVTNPTNCQIGFVAPTAGTVAAGPCYQAATPNLAYANDATTNPAGHYFPATTVPANTCTAANPCYTTSDTNATNTGLYAFNAPYTTLEEDKLFGYTFSYIHPVGNNVFNLSYDHYADYAQTYVNDAAPEPANCVFTVAQTTTATDTLTGKAGGAAPPVTYNGNTYNLQQPGCPLQFTRPSPISVAPTKTSVSTLAATLQLALTPKLEFDFGNYFTRYTILGQGQDPGLAAAIVAAGYPVSVSGAAPILLTGVTNGASHYDPHFGFVYRPSLDSSIRFTAGSSMTIPFGKQISSLFSAAQSQSTITFLQPNPTLLPESVVALDLGGDLRLQPNLLLSGDIYNDTIYNPWYSSKFLLPACPAGFSTVANVSCYSSQTTNAGTEHLQGVEFQVASQPAYGLGWRLSTSLERAYFLNLPSAILTSGPALNYDGEQLNFVAAGLQPAVPYAKGYGEVSYKIPNNGMALRMGVDYEGNNNGYGLPAFFLVDAGIRIPLPHGLMFQLTGENILNYGLGQDLSTGIATQGRQPVLQQYVNGAPVYSSNTFPSATLPAYQTFRAELQYRL